MPVYPALALLVGRRLAAAPEEGGLETPLERAGAAIAGAAFLALGLGAAAFPAVADRLPALLDAKMAPLVAEFVAALPRLAGPLAVGIGAATAALGLALLGAFGAPRPRRIAAIAAAAVAVASLGLHAVFIPALDPQKSARALGERVARDVAPGERLVLYPQEFDGIVNFWTGALHYDVAESPEAVRDALAAPGRLWFAAQEDFYAWLPADVKARLALRGAYRVGGRVIYLLSAKYVATPGAGARSDPNGRLLGEG
jgi:hypothetical protein